MRRGSDNGLLKNENGHVIGINLGADFCAEHEWGIKGLRQMFGMKDTGHGIDKRTAHEIPSRRNWNTGQTETAVHLIETKKETILLVGVDKPEKTDAKNMCRFELSRGDYNKDNLLTAWDERSFGVSGTTIEQRAAIKAIYEAMQGGDFAMWVGGGGVFQNGGLVLAIVSRLPADKLKVMRDADLDREALQKAADATGIAAKLKAAGKNWFALSPKWAKEFKDCKSKHDVIFWLNPMQQDIHNFGWFTVEDLELWADNKGPCMGGRNAEKRRA